MELLYCIDSEPTLLGLFDPSIAPTLLYYAYIPIVVVSLMVGFFVYVKRDQFSLPNKLLLIIAIIFSLHIFNEILQWIAVPAALVQFAWQMIAIFFTSLSLVLTYFVLTLVRNKDIYRYEKVGLIVLALPVIILLPTELNMGSFDLYWCESTTGNLYYYIYSLAVLTSLYMLIVGVSSYIKTKSKRILPLVFGSTAFIILLTGIDLFGELTGDFEFNLVGPVGMVIFLIAIAYLVVRFNLFNIKLLAAQALVLGLVALVGSQLFYVETTANKIIVLMNLTLSILGGFFLVRSVKREVKQREEIEKLAAQLERANKRLKVLDKLKSEFVSIASHQLRSPLTSIRGYASMLQEGSYGKLSQKAAEAVERISESSKYMATSIEDYLNVSRIQAGNMKYEYSDFNLKDEAEKIADDIRQEAIKKGLVLTFRSDMELKGVVNADIGKTRQIIHNLINNALKYTPQGSIRVQARDKKRPKRIMIDIVDTGIGMEPETIETMFEKFERADDANNVNVSGTGLGLYIARKMAQDMGGDITAKSEGKGKGSTFTLELPLKL